VNSLWDGFQSRPSTRVRNSLTFGVSVPILTFKFLAVEAEAKADPNGRQMASLAALVNHLQEECRIPTYNILLHRHLKSTSCPGENFPFYEFISLLEH
jgi:hypothetical protein